MKMGRTTFVINSLKRSMMNRTAQNLTQKTAPTIFRTFMNVLGKINGKGSGRINDVIDHYDWDWLDY